MNSKSRVKIAVAAALLSAASIPALATTVITPPSTGPVPVPGLTNGGVLVEVYDLSTGTALTEWLGSDTGSFGGPTSMPAGGETLDYGTLGGSNFATLFPSSEITAGNVVFTVSSVNDVNTTSPIVDLTLSQISSSGITFGAITKIAQAANTGISSVLNGATACNNVNPCLASSTSSPNYAVTYFGASLGGLASGSNAGGVVGGTGLDFYQIVGTGSTLTKQTLAQFANTTGAATWTLSATGDLEFNVPGASAVPLPAAVWLFGSGLLGLAGIGRRKLLAA